jgi:hypothetical protein
VFAFDYLILTRAGAVVRSEDEIAEGDALMLKVLAAKDSKSKAVFAHAIRAKGVTADRHMVDALVEDVEWPGCSHVILRSDDKNAIKKFLCETPIDLRIKVVDADEMITVQEEHSTPYIKQANGLAGVQ